MQHSFTDRRLARPLMNAYELANTGMRIADRISRELRDEVERHYEDEEYCWTYGYGVMPHCRPDVYGEAPARSTQV